MTLAASARVPSPDGTRVLELRRHLRAEVVAGEAAYVFSEHGVTALRGGCVETLLPLLDGTRTLSEVVRDMPPGTPAGQVEDLVTRLTLAGLVALRPHAPAAGSEAMAYWDATGLEATTAVERLAAARVAVLPLGGVDAGPARSALTAGGLTVTDGPADLTVVLTDDYLRPELADLDAGQRAAGRPWLLAKPVGTRVWVGPVFQPPGLGCWHCLAFRLRAHRQAEGYVQSALGRSGPAPQAAAALPWSTSTALQLVALEAAKWLAGHRYPGQSSVWTLDTLGLGARPHELRGRPQCPACGDPSLVRTRAWEPVRLEPRRKTCRSSGGHRALPPEQVLDTYRHLVSPVTGVVKEIVKDKRGPSFFNAYRSGANGAVGARSLRALVSSLRAENGGKGTDPVQAEVGALCEALERHSASFQGDEERVRGSLRSLGEPALHPNESMLFHERQYADRARWNAGHGGFQYVCAPFDPDAVLDWTPLWSLGEQRHRLLPTGLLYFDTPAPAGPPTVLADSNGNAAGASIEDAVLQGLFELVERDAVALWWYNRTRAPGVDLDALADPWVDQLREVYADLDREVWVLDVTSDLEVPAMVALSRRRRGPLEAIGLGFGAHLDPGVAVRRALTELNQMMPAIATADSVEKIGVADDPDAVGWFRSATVADHPYLLPDPAVRPRRPDDYASDSGSDLAEDVHTVRRRLAALGMDVLVLDQTRPDIGLPAVKVVVPGLRHFWSRYGPGRLYDVPVRLGRLAAPTPYEELNPTPLFL